MTKPIISYNWPAKFVEQYNAWLQNRQPPVIEDAKTTGDAKEYQNYMPIFIPVYPTYPYVGLPCTTLPFFPADSSGSNPLNGQTACPCYRQAPVLPIGNNAYILFLIFILIMLGTRKEQILAVIRKIFKQIT